MALNTSVLTAVKPTSKPEITTLLDDDTLIVFRGDAANLQMYRFTKQSLVDFITNIGGSGQSLDTTDDLAEGENNLYFTDDNLIDAFNDQVVTTDDLSEGNDNLYFTDSNLLNAFDNNVVVTDDLAEGENNFYFTEQRVYETFKRVEISSEDGTTGDTTILANGNLTGDLTFANMYYVLKVITSYPARIRLYTDSTARDNDINRPIGTDPTGNHGLLLEFVSSAGNLYKALTPAVLGYHITSTDTAISYTVTNLDTVTRSSVFSMEVVKLNEPLQE